MSGIEGKANFGEEIYSVKSAAVRGGLKTVRRG